MRLGLQHTPARLNWMFLMQCIWSTCWVRFSIAMLVGQKLNHRENIHGQPLSWSETTRTWFNGHGSNLFDPQKWIAQSMPKKNQTIIFWPSGKNPNFGPCSIPKMYMSENAELPPSYGHKIHGERYFQRKFQDAKMEVLYHMNPYKAIFGGDIPWHIPYRGLIIYIYIL